MNKMKTWYLEVVLTKSSWMFSSPNIKISYKIHKGLQTFIKPKNSCWRMKIWSFLIFKNGDVGGGEAQKLQPH